MPEFCRVLNYDELRAYMSAVPAPWLLKPRAEASALGIRKIQNSEELWRALDELGDDQTKYVLEQFVPGDIFHVDSIGEREQGCVRSGTSIRQAADAGDARRWRVYDTDGGPHEQRDWQRVDCAQRQSCAFTWDAAWRDSCRDTFAHTPMGGSISLKLPLAWAERSLLTWWRCLATGINLWREWARLEVANLRNEVYRLPKQFESYAGSVLCLAKTAEPDTAGFDAPEIVVRMKKHHHAGLIVRSESAERVRELLEQYSAEFAHRFLASMPVPDKPTA